MSNLMTNLEANGGTTIFIRHSENIQYSFGSSSGPWNNISNFPVNIKNSNGSINNMLTVSFISNITINSVSQYFICKSNFIRFHGNGNDIMFDGVIGYPGLIENFRGNSPNINNTAFHTITLQNINTVPLNNKTNSLGNDYNPGGWLCAAYFGKNIKNINGFNASTNLIKVLNCSNSLPIKLGGSGGIIGIGSADNGVIYISGCKNTGFMDTNNGSNGYCGGIVGNDLARNGGTATIIDCENSGEFIKAYAGGIVGSKCGEPNGNVNISRCRNSGTMGGNCGGIVGVGYGGTLTVLDCINDGNMGNTCGGILGQSPQVNHQVSVTNSYNTGNMTSYSESGGIAGSKFGGNTSKVCTIRNSYNLGIINTLGGGIVGADCGYTNNALYIPNIMIENCCNLGSICTNGGGIIGGSFFTSKKIPIITLKNCYNNGGPNVGSGIIDSSDGFISDRYFLKNGTLSMFVTSNVNVPRFLAYDNNGIMYVSCSGLNSIAKIMSDGTVSTFITGLNDPRGLAFDSLGNLYVANFTTNDVKKIDLSGNITTVINTLLFNPVGLAFDSSDNLYVVNNGGSIIQAKNINSTISLNILSDNLGESNGCIQHNDSLYVCSNISNTIWKISIITGAKSHFATIFGPIGITKDQLGNLYVSSNVAGGPGVFFRRVYKITYNGIVKLFLDYGFFTLSPSGQGPSGLAFDNSGNLYLANAYLNVNGNSYHPAGSTISKISIPSPYLIVENSYNAFDNSWSDSSANELLTGIPGSNNLGTIWTSAFPNKPWVLSSFNKVRLYNPATGKVYGTTDSYTTSQGLIQGNNYSIVSNEVSVSNSSSTAITETNGIISYLNINTQDLTTYKTNVIAYKLNSNNWPYNYQINKFVLTYYPPITEIDITDGSTLISIIDNNTQSVVLISTSVTITSNLVSSIPKLLLISDNNIKILKDDNTG